MTLEMKMDLKYEEGLAAGREDGIEQRNLELILKKQAKGKSIEEIAEEIEESVEYVEHVLEPVRQQDGAIVTRSVTLSRSKDEL